MKHISHQISTNFEAINQTQDTVFCCVSKRQEESSKYNTQQSIFDKRRDVWIEKTHVRQTLEIVFQHIFKHLKCLTSSLLDV